MGVNKWKVNAGNIEESIKGLQSRFNLPRPVALIFAARGIIADQVESFLNPRLANLSDPYRFPGIRDAAARLWKAHYQAIRERSSRKTVFITGLSAFSEHQCFKYCWSKLTALSIRHCFSCLPGKSCRFSLFC